MEKGIIVVDLPKQCYGCRFCKNYIITSHWWGEDTHEIHCVAYGNKILEKIPNNDKPAWCPIRPVPDKLNESSDPYDEYDTGYCMGWDSCLEKILGDETDEG